jgi:peptidoglycan hydrolase-like protein with peptidoglycan-binding domain
MKGVDVASAQTILKNLGYYNGKMDGIYGEQTGSATKAAKWDLGYAEKNVTSVL